MVIQTSHEIECVYMFERSKKKVEHEKRMSLSSLSLSPSYGYFHNFSYQRKDVFLSLFLTRSERFHDSVC
jgi:hypothetical protein